MDDFIPKPLNPADEIARATALLGELRGSIAAMYGRLIATTLVTTFEFMLMAQLGVWLAMGTWPMSIQPSALVPAGLLLLAFSTYRGLDLIATIVQTRWLLASHELQLMKALQDARESYDEMSWV